MGGMRLSIMGLACVGVLGLAALVALVFWLFSPGRKDQRE